MNRLITFPLLSVLVLAPVAAPSHAAAPIQLVRTGDYQMACPALAAEINSLAASTSTADPAPARKKGRRFLRALGSAATFVPGVALVRSAALVTAASAAQAGLAQAQAQDAMVSASSGSDGLLASQRRERLTAIFEEKHC